MSEETYQLVYRIGDEEHVRAVDAPELVMGRGPECQLQLPDYSISRQHAKVVYKDGEYIVVDLGSRNGTRVNGAKVQQIGLTDGDEITLGKFPVHFRRALKEKVVLGEGKPIEEGGGTIVRSVSELQEILSKPAPKADAASAPSSRAERARKTVSGTWLPRSVSVSSWLRSTWRPNSGRSPASNASPAAGMICSLSA